MKVFAYSAQSFRRSVRRAAGVEPVLSPPLTIETFDPAQLEGYEFLYFKLHGLPKQPFWYGDDWATALSADLIRQADLGGAIVYVANCYLPDSPMLEALLDAGARAVVGGEGENYARRNRVDGADLLGLYFRLLMTGPDSALRVAKKLLKLRLQTPAIRDAMAFKLYERK